MELSQLDLTIAWVSTLATTVGATLAAFKFLLREMRRGFDRNDDKFDRIIENLTDLRVAVGRHDERFDRIDERFDRNDERFNRIDDRFDRNDERFDRQDDKFTDLQVAVGRIEGHFGIGLPEPAIHTRAGSTPQTAAGSTAPTATGLTQT